MTMYLPNRDLHPTGAEIAEFIDAVPPSPAALVGTFTGDGLSDVHAAEAAHSRTQPLAVEPT